MSRLREELLEIQKEKFLKALLGTQYAAATEDQKNHFLFVIDDQIQIDVDKMLSEYILDQRVRSPEAQQSSKIKWVYIIMNIILSFGSAYAVNQEAWVFLGILGVLMVINQSLPFIYDKNGIR